LEKINEGINKFLPYGESLRQILLHPSIKDADIKQLLKLKGVFVENIADESTFPLLITNLLSPSEFNFLKEKIKSREDREKIITRIFDWDSNVNLISAIPDNFNIQEIVKSNYPRYKIVGSPNFAQEGDDPNKIFLEFKCETENYSKDWYRAKNEFKGTVSFEKIKDLNNKVQLQIVHTSSETTDVANKVVNNLEDYFKSNRYMNSNNEIEKIIFSDFTNDQRIKFFLSFTKGNDVFSFVKSSFIDISHDSTKNLPKGIDWMELAKVRELNIDGDGLDKLIFFTDKTLHQYMELCEMEIIYNFSVLGVEGECRVRFGFHGYFKKKISNTEFVIDIPKITPKENYLGITESTLRINLLKEFEKLKSEKYELLKFKPDN